MNGEAKKSDLPGMAYMSVGIADWVRMNLWLVDSRHPRCRSAIVPGDCSCLPVNGNKRYF